MTTFFEETVTCAVCGHEITYIAMGSTHAIGSPDLDMRPPPMQRFTMDTWVMRCPSCGYSAPAIGEAAPGAAETVKSAEYLELSADETMPELANRFLCWSMVAARADKISEALWAAVHAAWDCDDAGNDSCAVRCRRRALDLMDRADAAGAGYTDDAPTALLLRIDLLRRMEAFDSARKAALEAGAKADERIHRVIAAYQLRLICDRDAGCHAIEEADEAITHL